jgi:pilus assembly protein CpaE
MESTESSLIRVLPACLTEPLPAGWDNLPAEYAIEVMPGLERPEVIALALQTTEPDILLLDADFPDVDAFETVRAALAQKPDLAIILLSSDNSPERVRGAALSGVEEYLARPFEAGALRDKILAVATTHELRVVETETTTTTESVNGLVIGVMSGKGGLGKTTLATNLAAMLAKATKEPVGLIGFESGDGAVLLSLQPRVGLLDMAGSVEEGQTEYAPDFLRQFGTPHRYNLMYWTWQGSSTQTGGAIPEDFLPNLFATCRQTNHYTFVDFPLLNEDELLSVAPLLDVIIVVSSSSDLLALRSTKTFLDFLPEEMRPRMRIVVNRSDPSDMISKEDFEESLGYKVAATLPNDPSLAAQAINLGAPFVTTQNQSELADELRALGEKLFRVPLVTQNTKTKKRFSLF